MSTKNEPWTTGRLETGTVATAGRGRGWIHRSSSDDAHLRRRCDCNTFTEYLSRRRRHQHGVSTMIFSARHEPTPQQGTKANNNVRYRESAWPHPNDMDTHNTEKHTCTSNIIHYTSPWNSRRFLIFSLPPHNGSIILCTIEGSRYRIVNASILQNEKHS